MAIKSDNIQGNPWHDEGNGQFTSQDGGGSLSGEEIKKTVSYNNEENKSKLKEKLKSSSLKEALQKYRESKNPRPIEEKPIEEKPIESMLPEELRREINEHLNFFGSQGIIIRGMRGTPFFGGDLKLACANWRQLEKLIKKFPIRLKGCEFVNSTRYQDESGNWAYMRSTYISIDGYSLLFGMPAKYKFNPNIKMNFNAKRFENYNETKENVRLRVQSGWWIDCSDDLLVCQSITHEYGHSLHNQMYFDYLCSQNSDGLSIIEGVASKKDLTQSLNKFIAKMQKDVLDIYNKQNSQFQAPIGLSEFIGKVSKYGQKNNMEWFAETFASLMCGKPNTVAKALGEYLKTRGYTKED